MSRTVAVVTNIPRPYRTALFGTLKQQMAAQDLRLRVLYTSDPRRHVRRGSPAATVNDPEVEVFVPGLDLRLAYDHVLPIPTGLGAALGRLDPACVVMGGFGPSALLTARWCRRNHVPYAVWWGGWPGNEGEIGRLRESVRRRVVRRSAAFITYGTAAADYLATLGAPRERIFCAWNTVDLEGIAAAAAAAAARRPELAAKYGLAAKNLLFVGSLIGRKGVRELTEAALSVDSPHADWALHYTGGGPLARELLAATQAAGKAGNFRFHGLRPARDVVELLGLADGFFLPTREDAWGLVINEAMACGVPVVVSPLAGATRDLVEDGVTGYVVHPDDIRGMAALMVQMVSDDPEPRRIGQAGAAAVRAKASVEKSAEGFMRAVLCALEQRLAR